MPGSRSWVNQRFDSVTGYALIITRMKGKAMDTRATLVIALREAQERALRVEHNMPLAAALFRMRKAVTSL